MSDRRKLREKTVQLPQFDRVALVRSGSFDVEANTVEIVWTTGASVRRYDWWDGVEYDEVLSTEPKAVRLDRLNLGAPFLDTHCSYGLDNVIGSVVPDTARIADGKGTATIQLSKAAGVADTVTKIREGVIRNVSVGYWIHKVVKTEGDDGTVARWDVVDWEPLEISAVPIPADPGSQIRSAEPKDDKGPALRSCIVVTQKSPASAPNSKANKEASMATNKRTAAPKSPKGTAKRLGAPELTEDEKRVAKLREAERAAARAGKRDEDEDSDDERDADDDGDDKKDDEDSDDERDGDDKEDGDDDGDDKRDGDDDDADGEDAADDEDGKRSAPSKVAAKGKRVLTEAEVRKAAETAVRADRVRGAEIREIGAQFGFPKLADRHANGETSVRDFKDIVLKRLAERQNKRGNTTFAAAGAPEHGGEGTGVSADSRSYDKGAAEARALLGKK